jgi:dihydropteroate synthase
MAAGSDAIEPVWATARGPVALDRPRVIGILNVTPDSFWDGGRHQAVDEATRHADRLVEEGADLIDLGAESSRPGARPVPEREELARLLPVLDQLVRRHPAVPVSIDTNKAGVARATLAAGAAAINDVSALRFDPALAEEVVRARAGLVLMHSRGTLEQMAGYELAAYGDDPAADVAAELGAALDQARRAGIEEHCVVLDPGLGFAKRTAHSLAVLAGLARIVALGRPVMVGPSRKRFVGEAGHGEVPADRLEGTLAACVIALLAGARLFRVHDVLPVRRALAVADAARRAG